MPTIRQIQTAIDNAKAAGDQTAAIRLTQIMEQAKTDGAPEGDMPLSEALGRGFMNIPSSGAKFVGDMTTAVMHPLDTANTMLDLAAGGISRGIEGATGLNLFPENKATATADAVGHMYKDRYGSWDGFKRAIAEDPIGVASDLSLPLTEGGGLAAKAAGVTGKLGRAAQVAGSVMDPISVVTKGAGTIGRKMGDLAGYTSGVGGDAVRAGFNAARAGGAKAKAFYDNMRGNVPLQNVVDEAGANLDNIEQRGQAAYRNGMQSSLANTSPIQWQPIFQSVQDAIKSMSTKSGRFYGGPAGKSMVQDILNTMHQYVSDPSLHNVEGLDALKKELSGMQITMGPAVKTAQGQANRLVTSVVDAVRREINRVDPGYAANMDRYAEMKSLTEELKNSLSLHDKASVDTKLRKLQSTMRNNVQANYGARGQLLDELDQAGAGTLRPALAGQSMNTWAPRGIARAGGAYAVPAAIGWAMSNPGMLMATAAGLPAAMPRVVGEVSGLLGGAAGKVDKAVTAAIPSGVRAGVRAATSTMGRQAIRQAGAATNEADAMMTDAKGNVYDRKGRLIQRAAQ